MPLPWSGYEKQGDGRVRFFDDAGGEFLAVPTPSVGAAMAELDARKAPPPLPAPPPAPVAPPPMALQQPAPMVDKVVAINGPPQTMQLASDAPGPEAQGASGNAAPPAPEPAGAGGAPQAPPPSAQGQDQGQGGASQGTAAGQPAQPTSPIVRGGAGAGGPTAGDAAAGLYSQAAAAALRGSPGVFTPGGTFPTGKTVQYAPGPDPATTRAREQAERQLGNAQSDLVHVEARKQQEMAEAAQIEAQRAEARQRQMAELQAREQVKLDEVLGEIDTRRKDLADARLDPDRLIRTMSTGREMILAAGLALGVVGKALSGDAGAPMAFDVLDKAIKGDIEEQRFAIEQKRGDLNTLGEIYRLTKERFGNERMAQEAAYLAGTEVYKAKILRMTAEAEAAMGVETQYDENGEIVASSPYSMRAKEAVARLAVEQAARREALSQQMNGQIAQQFVTTQDKVTGGSGPNFAKAAEFMEKAAKAGESGSQQVTYGGQKFKLGSFVEQGEGKKLREEIGDIEATKREVSILEKELRDNPVGSRTYNASRVKGLIERVTSKANVILGQGAKNNDEAKRWEQITSGVLTNGVGAVGDMHSWLDDMAKRKLDQTNAVPVQQGPRMPIPQAVQDAASGKAKPSGGGVVGLPRQAAETSAPVVRANGTRATPLDRTGAAVIQATTATSDKGRASAVDLAKKSLRESLTAGQLGPREYKVAVEMAEAGQFGELLDFLGRMRSSFSVASPEPALTPQQQKASAQELARQLQMAGLSDYTTRAGADRALGVGSTVTTTVSTKTKGGGAPAVKAPKLVNLSGKKGR